MKIYLILSVGCLIVGAYMFGLQIARRKCEINVAHNQTNAVVKTISIQRITDEKVYNTGVADIRRVLHDKYTIAE